MPGLLGLGILVNVLNVSAVAEMREIEAAARTLGLEVVRLEIRRAEDIAPALETFKGPAHALYVVPTRSRMPTPSNQYAALASDCRPCIGCAIAVKPEV